MQAMMETTINQEALRARFNPEDSLLRRHQMRMLEMLVEVDRVCQKYDIPYWLSGGTLLGAVRHGGFIPWDDDLDIEMLKKDFDRLMQVLPAELPKTMALQTMKTDPNYLFFYAKIRDRNSRLEEPFHYERVYREQGIYIDIFPLYPHPKWIHKLSEHAYGHVYKIMKRMRPKDNEMWKIQVIKRFNQWVVHPILRFCCMFGNHGLRNDLGIPHPPERDIKDIYPLKKINFEGIMVPAPNDCDHFLTLQYGNYMQLPKLDEVGSQHVVKLEIYE